MSRVGLEVIAARVDMPDELVEAFVARFEAKEEKQATAVTLPGRVRAVGTTSRGT